MDHLTTQKRSWNMGQIRSQNTKPELLIRSFLHRKGFRFRICVKHLPGKPDIVLPKYKSIIQVRGCFWHRHKGCRRATLPKSNQEYWIKKFDGNCFRDTKNDCLLQEMGWKLLVIWECEVMCGKYQKILSDFLNIKE